MVDSHQSVGGEEIPQRDIVFHEFFWLPDDMCISILSKWMCNEVKEMSNLDIAFCSKYVRYLWIAASRFCTPSIHVFNYQKPKKRQYLQMLAWLASRDLLVKSFTLYHSGHDVIEALLLAARTGVFAKTEHITFSKSTVKDGIGALDEVLRFLSSLESLFFHFSPFLAHELRRLIFLLPNRDRLTHIMCRTDAVYSFDLCPNLTSLDLSVSIISMYEIMAKCADFARLTKMDVSFVAEDSHDLETIQPFAFPAIRSFQPTFVLPSVSCIGFSFDVALSTMEEGEYNQLYAFMLDVISAAPNLEHLEILDVRQGMRPSQTLPWKKLFADVLPKLFQFTYDAFNYNKLRFALTASNGCTLTIREPALQQFSRTDDAEMTWIDIVGVLQHSGTASFQCHFYDANIPWWTADAISGLSNVTELELNGDYFTHSSFYVALFSLPSLMTLTYKINAFQSVVNSLLECSSRGVRSPNLRNLYLDYHSIQGVVDFASLISPLPEVCPALQVLRYKSEMHISAPGLVEAVCRFPALQYLEVPFSTLEEMTAVQWQQVHLHSSCRRWRSSLPDPATTTGIAESIRRILETVDDVKVRVYGQQLSIVFRPRVLPLV